MEGITAGVAGLLLAVVWDATKKLPRNGSATYWLDSGKFLVA